jgi:hypothetical protein
MTREERAELRQRLSWLRPKMQVELPVSLVRELLADCDRLEKLTEAQLDLLDSYICRCGT